MSAASGTLPLTCWVVTDGKAGMENQCLGLAEALGLTPIVKRIRLRTPWRELTPFLRHGLAHAFGPAGDPVAAPWPDILIATGRASVPASLHARRMSRAQGGLGTLTVQIQNPVIDPSRFDLVVVPRHDALTGPNVMTTRGSLHRVTLEKLRDETAIWRNRLAHLPSPRIAVIIGGTNAVYTLDPAAMRRIAAQLRDLALQGYGLMVSPSRRTGADNLAVLQDTLRGISAYIWDGQGDNPYYGMLGLADACIVTCDSINLASESCATGRPVMVIDLPGGSDKFRRFHQSLRDDGLTRPFAGHVETYSYAPLNDMEQIATRVRSLLEQRGR